jgi:hypothetical protein
VNSRLKVHDTSSHLDDGDIGDQDSVGGWPDKSQLDFD